MVSGLTAIFLFIPDEMKMIELEPQPHAITSSVLLADTLVWNGGFGGLSPDLSEAGSSPTQAP